MTYRLSRAADHDLYTLYLDGLKKHGLLQTDAYYDELLHTLNLPAGNREMARVRDELRPPSTDSSSQRTSYCLRH